jgi:small subunit ribosomal protein S16
MLVIRLTRVGKKKDASFRVIVIDSKRKVQAGNYLEMVGSYDPRVDRAELKADRIKHWISEGAQPSDTVHNLLISKGIIEGKKINVLPKKTVAKADEDASAAAAAAVVPAEAVAAETTEEKAEETPADDAPVAEEAPATQAPAEAPAADIASADASAGGDASASA